MKSATASVYTGSLQAHKLAALYVHWHLGGTLSRSLWPTTTLQWNSAICLWIWRTRRITQIQGTQSKRAYFKAHLIQKYNNSSFHIGHRAVWFPNPLAFQSQTLSRVIFLTTVDSPPKSWDNVLVVVLSSTIYYYYLLVDSDYFGSVL